MKLAFSRPTTDATEQRLLFASFGAAGFEALQLKPGQYQRYLAAPDQFRDEWGKDIGAASALITAGGLDEAGRVALRWVIGFAHSIGSERVVFCHACPRAGLTSADLRGFARLLRELGLEARDTGVQLSLHHHHDQPVMHREDLDVFFAAAGEDALGLTLDTAHLVKSGVTDVPGIIRDFHRVIDNVHLKDYARGEFQVLGEGQIAFAPIFQALSDVGYDGWLCADEESGGDLTAGMQASARFIRRLMGS